jgi:hypothetical protein
MKVATFSVVVAKQPVVYGHDAFHEVAYPAFNVIG